MFGLGRIRLFSIFGIAVEAHWSLLVALMLFALGGRLPVALLLFASVLAHELGHSLVASRRGVAIAGIELHFFGGVAKMVNMPAHPADEIVIAAAGPATSLAIAAASLLLAHLTGVHTFALLAHVNTVLGLFNLLPALPMDGGRIFRAALQTRLGGLRATRIAAWVARALAVAMGIAGFALGQVFLPVLALFLWLLAGQELALAELRYGGVRVPGVDVVGAEEWAERARARALAEAYARMVEQLVAQLEARTRTRPRVRRSVFRDSAGRIVVIEEGVYRW